MNVPETRTMSIVQGVMSPTVLLLLMLVMKMSRLKTMAMAHVTTIGTSSVKIPGSSVQFRGEEMFVMLRSGEKVLGLMDPLTWVSEFKKKMNGKKCFYFTRCHCLFKFEFWTTASNLLK